MDTGNTAYDSHPKGMEGGSGPGNTSTNYTSSDQPQLPPPANYDHPRAEPPAYSQAAPQPIQQPLQQPYHHQPNQQQQPYQQPYQQNTGQPQYQYGGQEGNVIQQQPMNSQQQQSTTVIYTNTGGQMVGVQNPVNHGLAIGLAFFTLFCCNCCLGIPAAVLAFIAQSAQDPHTARSFNKISVILSIVGIILGVITLVGVIVYVVLLFMGFFGATAF